MAAAKKTYPVIQPNLPGIFLMPQLFRFGRADDQPKIALVWVRGESPAGVQLMLRLSHRACASFLQSENADAALLRDELELEVVTLPPDVKECAFPLLFGYKGLLCVDETGYIVEFSRERSDQRILISMSSQAYKSLLYHLKKLFPHHD